MCCLMLFRVYVLYFLCFRFCIQVPFVGLDESFLNRPFSAAKVDLYKQCYTFYLYYKCQLQLSITFNSASQVINIGTPLYISTSQLHTIRCFTSLIYYSLINVLMLPPNFAFGIYFAGTDTISPFPGFRAS